LSALRKECQAVFWRIDCAQRDEHALEGVGGRVTEAKQVNSLRRSNRLAKPQEEQRCTLEDLRMNRSANSDCDNRYRRRSPP
jgi:hypothetical protein